MKPGLPWYPWKDELMAAFECYAFAKQFNWQDDYIIKLKKENPVRYRMYTSMFDGFGQSEKPD